MDKMNQILEQLHLDANLDLEEIPAIDLYMDQVIQLFENKFSKTLRNEEDKVLTKTMINNYAKGKLIFPINNKKYSKEHIILICLIYQLKGALSINDIKDTLDGLNKKIVKDDIDLDALYKSYLFLSQKNVEDFHDDLNERLMNVKEEVTKVGNSPYLEQVLMITSLVHMSNLYRKTAEKLIDQLPVQKEGKRQK